MEDLGETGGLRLLCHSGSEGGGTEGMCKNVTWSSCAGCWEGGVEDPRPTCFLKINVKTPLGSDS